MNDSRRVRLAAQAKVMKALGHPTRLCLVESLAEGELCVCDLAEAVGAEISTVSRHLSRLSEAGVVRSRKEGLKVFYRLNCPCVLDFFTCVEGVLAAVGREQELLFGRS